MGQTLWCYDCCWFAQCYPVGCSYALFCCSCWICQPQYLAAGRPRGCCMTGGCNHGCGSSFGCYGSYCCPPEWLIAYSIREQIGNKRPNLVDLKLVDEVRQGAYSGQTMNMNGPGPYIQN